MTPPELTGDTPVLNIAHPGEVHVFVLLRYKLDVAVFNGFNRDFRQRCGTHIPLVSQHRLDNHAATVAVRHGQIVRFDLFKQAELIDSGNNRFTRREAFHVLESRRDLIGAGIAGFTIGVIHLSTVADIAVEGQDVDHRQFVTTTDFIVVEVMRRGNLDAAGAFFHVGMFVANDRDQAANQWQHHKFADQIFVARIFRVNRHAGIAQQGFRTGGGDHQIIFTVGGFCAVSQRIADMPHRAFALAVFHFQIGDSGTQFWIPVHQAFATVDQVLFIEANKHLFHGVGKAVVHGEALALPVDGVAQTAHLAGNGAAGFCFPLPDFVDERITAIVLARFTLFSRNFALNHHLRGDARVVSTRLPQGIFPLHALVTDHGVHDGLLEGVTHVQATGDVRRRDHDAKAFLAGIAIRFEVALLFPMLVKRLLDILRVICLFHFCYVVCGCGGAAVFNWNPTLRYAL